MEIVSCIFICKWKNCNSSIEMLVYTHTYHQNNKMHITSTQASKVFLCTQSQDLILIHYLMLTRQSNFSELQHFGSWYKRQFGNSVPTVRDFDFSRLLINKYEEKNVYYRRFIVLLGGGLEGRGWSVLYILLISQSFKMIT